VNVNDVEPFNGMLGAPNALAIVAGAITVMLAIDVLPLPPSVEVTVTLLLFAPAVVPVTLTLNEHDALDASVAPASAAEPLPAVAVVVPPPQLPLRPFGVAITRPAGKVSVNATPVSVNPEFGFVMLNVSDVVPFSGMVVAPKVFVIDGGDATVRFAVAVLPVPPLVEVTAPVVFVY
jgi:hypothetical protein